MPISSWITAKGNPILQSSCGAIPPCALESVIHLLRLLLVCNTGIEVLFLFHR